MLWQVRRYTMNPDVWDEFLDLFRNYIVPAREKWGWTVVGGWIDRDRLEFTWIVGHPAPEGWEAAEDAYLEDPDRQNWPAQPNIFIASQDNRMTEKA
jgi:hypothetical protein